MRLIDADELFYKLTDIAPDASLDFSSGVAKAMVLILNAPTIEVPRWIPVTERLPEKKEYLAKAECGTEYLVRLLIAYKTDTVEYEIGYYDGFKWLSEMPTRKITDVVAWKPFLPLPEPPKDGGSA